MARTYSRKIPDNMNPWECSVNGKKYVYPSGTVQEVDEEVAEIIDQTAGFPAAAPEEKPPFEAQGGGSGGSDRLDIVLNISESSIASNVTYDQVLNAFENKLPISFGIYDNTFFSSGIISDMRQLTDGSFQFELASIVSPTKLHILTLELSGDGTWNAPSA